MPKLSEEREIVLTLSMEEDEDRFGVEESSGDNRKKCGCRLPYLLHKFCNNLDLFFPRAAGEIERAKNERLALLPKGASF